MRVGDLQQQQHRPFGVLYMLNENLLFSPSNGIAYEYRVTQNREGEELRLFIIHGVGAREIAMPLNPELWDALAASALDPVEVEDAIN